MSGAVSNSRPLYLITDGSASLGSQRTITIIRDALAGAGTNIAAVIVREQVSPTPLADDALKSLIDRLRPLCSEQQVAVIAHRRADLARDLGCSGVHLQEEPQRVAEARKDLGSNALIGYSAHSGKELEEAFCCGASYCFFSPVFSPQSKTDNRRSIGLEYLREVCKSSSGAVIALGGITAATAPLCAAAGATGIAVIGSIFSAPDPKNAAAELVAAWFNRT